MEQKQVVFSIIKLFTSDASIEIATPLEVFLGEKPIDSWAMNFETNNSKLRDDIYSSELVLHVKGMSGEKEMVIIEVKQEGLFNIQNLTEQELEYVLNVEAPSMLFPYVREFISSALHRVGLSSFDIAPINFAAIFQEKANSSNPGSIEKLH